MATLVVIYLMAPIVVRFKDSVSEKVFRIAAYLFLIWAGISFNTSEHLLNWDVGYGIEYLGYFMVGYVIRKDARNTAPKIKWGSALVLAVLCELLAAFLQYGHDIVNRCGDNFSYFSPLGPIVMAAAVLLFFAFSTFQTDRENQLISRMSKRSFMIYLIHAGVWDLICKLVKDVKGSTFLTSLNPIWWVPIFVVWVTFISYMLTLVYECLYERVSRRVMRL